MIGFWIGTSCCFKRNGAFENFLLGTVSFAPPAAQILWVRIVLFFFLWIGRKILTGTGIGGHMIVQVWTVSMPVVMLNSPAVCDPALGAGSNPAFGTARDVVGIVLWAVGLAIETVSDAQTVALPF